MGFAELIGVAAAADLTDMLEGLLCFDKLVGINGTEVGDRHGSQVRISVQI